MYSVSLLSTRSRVEVASASHFQVLFAIPYSVAPIYAFGEMRETETGKENRTTLLPPSRSAHFIPNAKMEAHCTSNGITNVKEMLSCFDEGLHVALASQVHKICDGIAQGLEDLETNNDKKARDAGSGIVQDMRTGVHCEHCYAYMCEYICSVFAASLM